jgi:hypothetical protein
MEQIRQATSGWSLLLEFEQRVLVLDKWKLKSQRNAGASRVKFTQTALFLRAECTQMDRKSNQQGAEHA